MLDRWEALDGSDLRDLYKKWDKVLEGGPGTSDPKLWFLELQEKEEDIVDAGGQKKEEKEFLALLETTMENADAYKKVVQMIQLQEKRDDLMFWKTQLFDFWKRNLKNKCYVPLIMGIRLMVKKKSSLIFQWNLASMKLYHCLLGVLVF